MGSAASSNTPTFCNGTSASWARARDQGAGHPWPPRPKLLRPQCFRRVGNLADGTKRGCRYLRVLDEGNRSASQAGSPITLVGGECQPTRRFGRQSGVLNSHRSFYLRATIHIYSSVQHWMDKMLQLEHISNMFQSEHLAQCSSRNIRAVAPAPRPEALCPRPPLHPLGQPAPIFFQQKASHAKTFPEDAMRFLVACRA
jgi:hypothetical protein